MRNMAIILVLGVFVVIVIGVLVAVVASADKKDSK